MGALVTWTAFLLKRDSDFLTLRVPAFSYSTPSGVSSVGCGISNFLDT